MKPKIIYEDAEILVVDKPSGLVVNRAETVREETLQDGLSDYFELGSDLGVGERAGIVHRLDRETSGLVIVAKTQKAFDTLQAQFKNREVKKEYIALVHGQVKDRVGSISHDIGRIGKFGKFGLVGGGKESKTDYSVDERYYLRDEKFEELIARFTKPRANYLKSHARSYTLVNLYPKTGRTHQIRVHVKSIGHPVVSDLIYAPKKLLKSDQLWCPRLFLHASKIEFAHPKTKKTVSFSSILPKDLKDAILNLTIVG